MRTCSLPRRPSSLPRAGSREDPQRRARRTPRRRRRGSPTRRRVTWSGMPPTSPPMNGRAFQMRLARRSGRSPRASTSGSRTSACDWKALTSIAPTLLKLLRMWMSGSPAAWAIVALKKSQPSGSSEAMEPTSASWTSGMLLLDDPVGVDHAERVLPRVEARDLAHERPVDVDPELLADVDGVLGREGHVLRGQRVDRRRHDVDVPLQPVRGVRRRGGRPAPGTRRS